MMYLISIIISDLNKFILIPCCCSPILYFMFSYILRNYNKHANLDFEVHEVQSTVKSS